MILYFNSFSTTANGKKDRYQSPTGAINGRLSTAAGASQTRAPPNAAHYLPDIYLRRCLHSDAEIFEPWSGAV